MAAGTKRQMISLAIDDELAGQLARLMAECRYTSRSRAVRDALRHLIAEKCDPAGMRGRVRGTVTLLTGPGIVIGPVLRANEDTVRSHLETGRDLKGVLHVLVVAGDAARVRALLDALGDLEGVHGIKTALF